MRWLKDTRSGDVTGISCGFDLSGKYVVEIGGNPEGFTPRLKEICADRCSEFGDPPCWKLPEMIRPCEHITPCDECLDDEKDGMDEPD